MKRYVEWLMVMTCILVPMVNINNATEGFIKKKEHREPSLKRLKKEVVVDHVGAAIRAVPLLMATSALMQQDLLRVALEALEGDLSSSDHLQTVDQVKELAQLLDDYVVLADQLCNKAEKIKHYFAKPVMVSSPLIGSDATKKS